MRDLLISSTSDIDSADAISQFAKCSFRSSICTCSCYPGHTEPNPQTRVVDHVENVTDIVARITATKSWVELGDWLPRLCRCGQTKCEEWAADAVNYVHLEGAKITTQSVLLYIIPHEWNTKQNWIKLCTSFCCVTVYKFKLHIYYNL